ncbi:hypothetical protein HDV00_006529 [Rhizophlyctis rosea]|nr:hypothetical protein HDV00_006529 [Rhizophlyctis rosea]
MSTSSCLIVENNIPPFWHTHRTILRLIPRSLRPAPTRTWTSVSLSLAALTTAGLAAYIYQTTPPRRKEILRISASRIIRAPIDVVYEILADYSPGGGHASIMPEAKFDDLKVSEPKPSSIPISSDPSTRPPIAITFTTHVFGQPFLTEATISFPSPNTIVASIPKRGFTTTFTLSETSPTETLVTIESAIVQTRSPTLWYFEKKIYPLQFLPGYRQELENLEKVAVGREKVRVEKEKMREVIAQEEVKEVILRGEMLVEE